MAIFTDAKKQHIHLLGQCLVIAPGSGVAIRIGAFSVADGALAAGAGILVVFVTVECFRPVQEAQDYWFEGFGGITAAGAVLDFLQARPAVTEPSAPVPLPATRPVELSECLPRRLPAADLARQFAPRQPRQGLAPQLVRHADLVLEGGVRRLRLGQRHVRMLRESSHLGMKPIDPILLQPGVQRKPLGEWPPKR